MSSARAKSKSKDKSAAKTKKANAEVDKISVHHGDPNGDLILVSKTGITFKVRSHYWLSKSAMISDTFALTGVAKKRKFDEDGTSSSTTRTRSTSPDLNIPTIDLDCSTHILLDYIVLMQTPKPIMNLTLMKAFGLTFDEILALQGVCRMMQVTEWDEEINELLKTRDRVEPWRAFRDAVATDQAESRNERSATFM